jgi:hypothetical protein
MNKHFKLHAPIICYIRRKRQQNNSGMNDKLKILDMAERYFPKSMNYIQIFIDYNK